MGERSRDAARTGGRRRWHRRDVLGTVGLATAIGLAGCSSSEGPDSESTGEQAADTDTGSDTTPSESAETSDSRSGATGTRMYRVDAANSGHAPEETGPAADPVEKWSHQMETVMPIQPAVYEGTVHVGPELDASDGTMQWDGPEYDRSPAIVDGYRYSVANTELNAADLDDALNEWNYYFTSDPSTPTVVGDVAYIGYERGQLYALTTPGEDEEGVQVEGVEVWSFQQPGDPESDLETPPFTTPAVADGTVYACSGNNLYALDAATGDEQWVQEGVAGGMPTVVDGAIYFATGERIVARSVTDGTELWESPVGLAGPVAVANGTLYVAGGELHAIDVTDGSVTWTTAIPGPEQEDALPEVPIDEEAPPSLISSLSVSGVAPVVAGGIIYTARGGVLSAFNTNGGLLWSFDTGDDKVQTPAVADGDLYAVASSDILATDPSGRVIALTEP